MIWNYLSNEQLQEFIGSKFIDELKEIIPAITNVDANSFNINQKDILLKIINSFLTESFFKDKKNRLKVLNSINVINIDCLLKVIAPDKIALSFEKKIEFIASQWNSVRYHKKIREWAGLPGEIEDVDEIKSPSTIKMRVPEHPYKMLKDYQMSIFIQAIELLNRQGVHFVIQMPTGSGKTRTAMEIVSNFINENKENVHIVWLAHSEELCEQAATCFQEVWEHIAKKELAIYKYWGKHNSLPTDIETSSFVVGGLQKLYSAYVNNPNAFDKIKEHVSLIIVDEAHKIIAPSYKTVVNAIGNLYTKTIGLTATPGRNINDIEGNNRLSDFFHGHNVTIKSSNNDSVIKFLRNKKVLSLLDIESLTYSTRVTLTERDREYIARNFDFPPAFLKKLGTNSIRNIEILRALERECKENRQIIFFACNVEHSKFICSMLTYLGYKASHVDGSTDKQTRERILKKFKRNEIQVICNFGVLSTGFDAPNTDVVCIARPTTSIVLYSQMIGRGLRGPAIGGTPSCKLINVRDNIENLPDYELIFDYFDEYWS